MEYQIDEASDAEKIKECEYARAARINFTPFTSCIGVIAKHAGEEKITAIHLVLVKSKDVPDPNAPNKLINEEAKFDKQAVGYTISCLPKEWKTAAIVGQTRIWEEGGGSDEIKKAYQRLKQILNKPIIIPTKNEDGAVTYRAEIAGGTMKLYEDGVEIASL